MATLADYIEKYLQELLQETDKEFIELQRRMLAQHFQCVPSQINYVLTTRFTLDRGYLVESRRGEGGYIRIQKIALPRHLLHQVVYELEDSIGKKQAEDLLYSLREENILTEREYRIIRYMLQEMEKNLASEIQGKVRSSLLKGILLALG